jgi:hypothetical protein
LRSKIAEKQKNKKQVAFKDSFAERLLENELHFNRLLAHNIPAHHGRRWAKILGTCRADKASNQSPLLGFPDEVLRKNP